MSGGKAPWDGFLETASPGAAFCVGPTVLDDAARINEGRLVQRNPVEAGSCVRVNPAEAGSHVQDSPAEAGSHVQDSPAKAGSHVRDLQSELGGSGRRFARTPCMGTWDPALAGFSRLWDPASAGFVCTIPV